MVRYLLPPVVTAPGGRTSGRVAMCTHLRGLQPTDAPRTSISTSARWTSPDNPSLPWHPRLRARQGSVRARPCRPGLNRVGLAHNPEVAGSNPAPWTCTSPGSGWEADAHSCARSSSALDAGCLSASGVPGLPARPTASGPGSCRALTSVSRRLSSDPGRFLLMACDGSWSGVLATAGVGARRVG